jgi:hypothetical protein
MPQILLDLRAHRNKLHHWTETQLRAGQEYLETELSGGNLSPDDSKILATFRKHLSALEDLKHDS